MGSFELGPAGHAGSEAKNKTQTFLTEHSWN